MGYLGEEIQFCLVSFLFRSLLLVPLDPDDYRQYEQNYKENIYGLGTVA